MRRIVIHLVLIAAVAGLSAFVIWLSTPRSPAVPMTSQVLRLQPKTVRALDPAINDDLPPASRLRDVVAKLWYNPDGPQSPHCYATLELNRDLLGYVDLPEDWCVSLRR